MSAVPTSVFKYVTADRVDIILNERIAFTPPNRFNDSFDVRPQVKPVTNKVFLRKQAKAAERTFLKSLPRNQLPRNKGQMREILRGLRAGAVEHVRGQAKEFAADLEAQLQDEISKIFGILCLCEVCDDDQMWAHYADSQHGFAIEFDTAHPSFRALGQCVKVDYLQARPTYDPVAGADGFWRKKPAKWIYEHEWRISRRLDECEQPPVDGITIYLCPVSRESIKAVYLGLRSDDALHSKIRSALSGTRSLIYHGCIEKGASKLSFRKL